MAYQSNSVPFMSVHVYPGGQQINVPALPANTVYKWIDAVGGQHMTQPARMGDIRPDGKKGHGGVATRCNGICTVEYHGHRS